MSLYLNDIMGENDETNSDLSEHGRFLTKGAFLLTPSYDLSLDKAASICDKLNFRGSFSLTKTATGILFKFSEPEDYQQVFRKGFHKLMYELGTSPLADISGYWRAPLQKSGNSMQTSEDLLSLGNGSAQRPSRRRYQGKPVPIRFGGRGDTRDEQAGAARRARPHQDHHGLLRRIQQPPATGSGLLWRNVLPHGASQERRYSWQPETLAASFRRRGVQPFTAARQQDFEAQVQLGLMSFKKL